MLTNLNLLTENAIQQLSHRGPDFKSVWTNKSNTISLAHSRLSIIDLSESGNQPMASSNGRYMVTYNGEIYNHAAIRSKLENKGYRFKGSSDTEVLCYCFDEWGIRDTINKLEGMYAIGVYDTKEKELSIARDQQGEKPLYYSTSRESIYFASELKALTPNLNITIRTESIKSFLDFGYISAPHTIYNEVNQLQPGEVVTFKSVSEIKKSWPQQSLNQHTQHSNIIDKLDLLLNESIALRLKADVKVGCFLSGGIDSSLIAAIASRKTSRNLRTFSIGFKDPKYDESIYANNIASFLETNHTSIILDASDCISVIQDLPTIYDEPFSDPSQIPTALVCKLASKDVKVAISGDAGDELFGGYNRHVTAHTWQKLQYVPKSIRNTLWNLLKPVECGSPSWALNTVLRLLSSNMKRENIEGFSRKIDSLLRCTNPDSLYHEIMGRLNQHSRADHTIGNDALARFLELDQTTYLPNNILTKIDRAAMASSLETRIPLLSPSIINFANTLPNKYKVRGRETKWILKQVLYRYIPKEFFKRPKSGFNIPIANWLRGPLNDWAVSLIEEAPNLPIPIELDLKSDWNGFMSGDNEKYQLIWNYLCLSSWKTAQTRHTPSISV